MRVLAGIAAVLAATAAWGDAPAQSTPARPALAVLAPNAPGLAPGGAAAIGALLAARASKHAGFTVLGPAEVRALVGEAESARLSACAEPSCLAALAEKGPALVLASEVSAFAGRFVLSLSLVDLAKGQTVARATRMAPGEKELLDLVEPAADEVLGGAASPAALVAAAPVEATAGLTPKTKQILRIGGYSLGGAGLASLGVATVFGVRARTAGNRLGRDYAGGGIWTASAANDEWHAQGDERTTLLFGLIGAGAIAAGGVFYWLGREPAPVVTVAPVALPGGGALTCAGSF
jgi:hypothetical protein